MIKNFLKKPTKKIVPSILLLLLFIGASYAYFTNGPGYSLTNENLTIGNALNISYLLEAKTDISFYFNALELTQGGPEYKESEPSTAHVTLGNNSEYDNIKCTYEIWYTPSKVYTNSTNAGEAQEMVIIGSESSNQNTAFTFDLNGVNEKKKMADGVIYVRSKTADIMQTWTFKLRHYNLDVLQNENIGKSFGGTIEFKPLGCKNE